MADARRADAAGGSEAAAASAKRVWIERLQLTDFRNYAGLSLSVGPAEIFCVGSPSPNAKPRWPLRRNKK